VTVFDPGKVLEFPAAGLRRGDRGVPPLALSKGSSNPGRGG